VVAVLTVLVLYRFDAFNRGMATPVDVVVLLVWIALLVAPLFREVSIFGVRLNREIDSLREEVREQIWTIRNDIHNANVVRSEVNPTFYFGSLLTDAELEKLAGRFGGKLKEAQAAPQEIPPPPEQSRWLFSVRYALDQELNRLAALFAVSSSDRPWARTNIAIELSRRGFLDQASVASLREVYGICNAAIHGAKVSPAEISFVQKVGPALISVLKSIDAPP